MNTNELVEKFEKIFDLSKKKKKKKHEKFVKIVKKLERKKTKLEAELVEESRQDESSESYHALKRELQVVLQLIRKAENLSLAD
jgi:hypothetical protein